MKATKTPVLSESLKDLLADMPTSCCAYTFWRAYNRMLRKGQSRIINASPPGDYFTFRESEGMITFCPTGKEQQFTDDGCWKRAGRQGMKPVKWLRSMFNPRLVKRIKDHQLAGFDARFKVVESEGVYDLDLISDITSAYDTNNWDTSNTKSCMWDENVGEFYKHYDCKVLVVRNTDNDKMVGRALVWFDVNVNGAKVTFMDRIYSDTPEVVELMKQHAAKNGWWRKLKQSNDSETEVLDEDGTARSVDMYVTAEYGDVMRCSFFPYLDTFRNMDTSDGMLYNYSSSCADAKLDNTDGTLTHDEDDEDDGYVYDVDGDRILEEDAVLVNGNYYPEDDSRIARCRRSDEWLVVRNHWVIPDGYGGTEVISDNYVTSLSGPEMVEVWPGGGLFPASECYEVARSYNETVNIHADDME